MTRSRHYASTNTSSHLSPLNRQLRQHILLTLGVHHRHELSYTLKNFCHLHPCPVSLKLLHCINARPVTRASATSTHMHINHCTHCRSCVVSVAMIPLTLHFSTSLFPSTHSSPSTQCHSSPLHQPNTFLPYPLHNVVHICVHPECHVPLVLLPQH